jgi:hypothetical protein
MFAFSKRLVYEGKTAFFPATIRHSIQFKSLKPSFSTSCRMSDPLEILKAAQARMASIDALLEEPEPDTAPVSSSGTKPPSGLTADEEVAWWKNKIADLSGDPAAQSKENAQNVKPFTAGGKEDSGYKASPGAKGTRTTTDAKGAPPSPGAGEAKNYRK